MAAEYDEKKPVTLKGIVTKFDWTNPHVFVFVDVTVKWRRHELGRRISQPHRTEEGRLDAGFGSHWRHGDGRGIRSRATAANRRSRKQLTLASGKKLNAAPAPFLKVS